MSTGTTSFAPPAAACTLRLRGGQTGLHDLAGNVLVADVRIPFTTSTDTETPSASLAPNDGAANVANGQVSLTLTLSEPLDAENRARFAKAVRLLPANDAANGGGGQYHQDSKDADQDGGDEIDQRLPDLIHPELEPEQAAGP